MPGDPVVVAMHEGDDGGMAATVLRQLDDGRYVVQFDPPPPPPPPEVKLIRPRDSREPIVCDGMVLVKYDPPHPLRPV